MAKGPSKKQRAEQASQLVESLRRHPRMDYQGLISAEAPLDQLRRSMPYLVPFPGSEYVDLLPILDWDHRLPSRMAVLRLYAFYAHETLAIGEQEYVDRMELIRERDEYPEFDVPDFAGLTADEAYEAVVDANGQVAQIQLVSEWRQEIETRQVIEALNVVRKSAEFQKVSQSGTRPDYLGDLEARNWTPPCEGAYHTWTVDVLYLLEYNGVMGKGLSFLVDLDINKVANIREFMLRTT